jgi:hypothetical protein
MKCLVCEESPYNAVLGKIPICTTCLDKESMIKAVKWFEKDNKERTLERIKMWRNTFPCSQVYGDMSDEEVREREVYFLTHDFVGRKGERDKEVVVPIELSFLAFSFFVEAERNAHGKPKVDE